jgi:hypothetical protein
MMILIIAFIVAGVLAHGALLWLIAHILAPADSDISLLRGLWTGVVMSIWYNLCQWVIDPKIGVVWGGVLLLVGSVFVIRWGFRFSFLRSALVCVILWIVLILAVYLLVVRPDQSLQPRASQSSRVSFASAVSPEFVR